MFGRRQIWFRVDVKIKVLGILNGIFQVLEELKGDFGKFFLVLFLQICGFFVCGCVYKSRVSGAWLMWSFRLLVIGLEVEEVERSQFGLCIVVIGLILGVLNLGRVF